MKLSDALAGMSALFFSGNPETEIMGLTEDSRNVRKGDLFFARRGSKVSGVQFVKEALAKGAAALVCEEKLDGIQVPFVQVLSIGKAESQMSENFYKSPSKKLKIVGVTGTNGKTTFTYLMEAIAAQAAKRVGVIGTINYRLPKSGFSKMETLPAPNTTPNILELQNLLHKMVQRKCDWAVLEVSSHALALGRVDPINFLGSVFTNLTPDHLDFHKTMEEYFDAKAKLFKRTSVDGFSVVNADDPYGKRIMKLSNAPVTTYGIENPSDFMGRHIHLEPSGSRFTLSVLGQALPLKLRLTGKHNAVNS